MLLGWQAKLLGFDGKGDWDVWPGQEHAAPIAPEESLSVCIHVCVQAFILELCSQYCHQMFIFSVWYHQF